MELLDTAKTEGVIPVRAAVETSSLVLTGFGGVTDGTKGLLIPAIKDANPPMGCLAMLNRNVLSILVEFCTKITKARCTVVLSGFEFCGEDTVRPCVMRLL